MSFLTDRFSAPTEYFEDDCSECHVQLTTNGLCQNPFCKQYWSEEEFTEWEKNYKE